MPILRWDAFNNTHHRPYVVFADCPERQQSCFDLLRRLAVAMRPTGDLALFPDEGFVRIIFELNTDAEKFADGVQAKRTAREGGWVGQWAFGLDEKMARTIETVLNPIKATATTRAGVARKMKRRMLPL